MALPDGIVVEFTKDTLPIDHDPDLGGNAWAEFAKKTATRAIRIDRPFAVVTIHGGETQRAKPGDWLAVDSEGFPYPIAKDVFEATFQAVADLPEEPDVEPLLAAAAAVVKESGEDAGGNQTDVLAVAELRDQLAVFDAARAVMGLGY